MRTLKRAQLCVSKELLREALAMPEDTVIHSITPHKFRRGVFVFCIEHPDLPSLSEGEVTPEIAPVITADYDKKPSMWLTWSWGLEDEEK